MNIVRRLVLSGTVFGCYALGLEGGANAFEYAARQGTLITKPAFEDAADISRDFRDFTGVIAAVELAGAVAISFAIRNKNYEVSG